MKKRKLVIIFSIAILFTLTLAAPHVLSQVKRGAAVPIDQVPEKLKKLDIKDYFIASDFKGVGIIHALRGTIVVLHKATGKAYFGMEGDYIYENDVLETLAKSRCRLRLFNEDVISMAPDSNLAVDEVTFSRKKREKRSFFSMLKGKVMFYSLRLFSFRKSYARLKTPTAVVGVRGTKFGVYVYWEDGEKQAKGPIQVADLGNNMGMYVAKADPGEGGKSYTRAHFEDGDGYVDKKDVPAGFTYDSKTDETNPTDPTYAKDFEEETSVEEKLREPEKPFKPPVDTGEKDPDWDADMIEKIADIALEHKADGETQPSGQYGYFTAFLSSYIDIDAIYSYASINRSLSRQDFGGETVSAYSVSDYITATGQSAWDGGTPYVKEISWLGYSSSDLGTSQPIVVGQLGSNSYLTWGWWNSPGTVTIDLVGDYAIYHPENDRQGYYIFGPNPADINALSGTYTYTGDAYGSFYVSDSSEAMTGTFGCTLTFGTTPTVSNFNLSVSGATYGASISGALGTLSPTGDNHINLDYTSGTWQLVEPTGGPVSATYGDVKGSVYGTNGEAVGGVWKMGADNFNYHATGIYQGTKVVE
jgi:hypothetical protein